jgi:CheY-like chemotaxis protein
LLRILIVDDEPLLVRALERLLTRAGFDTLSAGDGRAALDLLAQNDFALILCDVRMPVLDGVGLLQALGRRGPPVVMLTGYGDESDQALRDLGAKAVLGKPVTLASLKEVIAEFASKQTPQPQGNR